MLSTLYNDVKTVLSLSMSAIDDNAVDKVSSESPSRYKSYRNFVYNSRNWSRFNTGTSNSSISESCLRIGAAGGTS